MEILLSVFLVCVTVLLIFHVIFMIIKTRIDRRTPTTNSPKVPNSLNPDSTTTENTKKLEVSACTSISCKNCPSKNCIQDPVIPGDVESNKILVCKTSTDKNLMVCTENDLERISEYEVAEPTLKHDWLICALEAHNRMVLCLEFSPDGKYLCSTAEDREIIIWNTAELLSGTKRPIRKCLEWDNAGFVRFFPDSGSLLTAFTFNSNLSVFNIFHDTFTGNVKIKLATDVCFRKIKHESEIIGIGISTVGKFMMSVSSDKMLFWNLIGGDPIKVLETKYQQLYQAKLSPCGHYVATSGFHMNVEVYKATRNDNTIDVVKAFELKGDHLLGFAFNTDATRMVTTSQEARWTIWDTKIGIKKGVPIEVESHVGWSVVNKESLPVATVMAPDGWCFAMSVGSQMGIYQSSGAYMHYTGHIDLRRDGIVRSLAFSPDSKYLAVSSGNFVYILHAMPGYCARIRKINEELRDMPSNLKDKEERIHGLKMELLKIRGKLMDISLKQHEE